MSLRAQAAALAGLVLARARGRPGRWLLTAGGLALATAFAGTVVAEGTIAADRSAHAALTVLSPQDRAVRVTWTGLLTPSVERTARSLLAGLVGGPQTEVVLLGSVRLGAIVVRPAAIEPLQRWTDRRGPGPCRAGSCPMFLTGDDRPGPRPGDGAPSPGVTLAAPGVRVPILGRVRLNSPVPLGFAPSATGGAPPLLLGGDAAGLERLGGLSGIYRTHSWLAALPVSSLRYWELAGLQRRLQRAQASLQLSGSQFTLSAPFAGLEAARSQGAAGPQRLLMAGGGALTALVLFVVLAAGGLRRDQEEELERLRAAGATTNQCLAFVVAEAALVCSAGLLLGAVLGLVGGPTLAAASGSPAAGVLAHSLLTPAAAASLAAGWFCATALISLLTLARGRRLGDLLALAAAAALALSLARGSAGTDPLPVLLAPLSCVAAGVLVCRFAAVLLRAGERAARGGPALLRVAVIGLARAPDAPALAIAFIAVSTGLGGFALSYRATLLRGAADQAADRVPLDAIVAAGPSFAPPLALAPLPRWRSIAEGAAFAVRRTDASYADGGAVVSVPAIGLPAAALPALHGWRSADAAAPLRTLARRLTLPGSPRAPGPALPAGAGYLSLRASAHGVGVTVTADLRDRSGAITRVALGMAQARPATLRARLPAGNWELAALELQESAGLELTNGHQNGENASTRTQFQTTVALGPVSVSGDAGRRYAPIRLPGWLGVGAASGLHRRGAEMLVGFATTGAPGVLRPLQPTDQRPLPVLVDGQTAAVAGRGGRLALTVDGLPVSARVVGVLGRFPTLSPDAAGFVVADGPSLAAALDAQLPGQGRADELWISSLKLSGLRAALSRGPLAQLSPSFRADIERGLRDAPVQRGVLGTLLAAAAVSAALAVLGLLVSLLGSARDRRLERDLMAEGVGPRWLRRELVSRMLLAAALGVLAGLLVAALLTRLAVSSVRASGTVALPRPPLVIAAPWLELCLWGLAALAALALTSVAAASRLGRERPAG